MKKQWLYGVDEMSKVDCAAYADGYADHKVIGADWDESDKLCVIFFNDEDAFAKYLDYVNDQVDNDDMIFRWRCLNGKKY